MGVSATQAQQNVLDLVSISQTPDTEVPETVFGTNAPTSPVAETGGNYAFSHNFQTDGGVFTLTGDFDLFNGDGDAGMTYYAVLDGAPGTFVIDQSTGAFTYTLTAAEFAAFDAANSNNGNSFFQLSVVGNNQGILPGVGADVDSSEDPADAADRINFEDVAGLIDIEEFEFDITLCFAEGTGIATPTGATAVEALHVGDLVRTADGRDVAVSWVGKLTLSPMFNPAARLAPVLIRKGALGDSPHRDLIVTADHGMILEGHVINAGALVGFPGIEWVDWKALGETVTYYHVETTDHDVILANGAEAETYIDYVARKTFDNYSEYRSLYGEEQVIAEMSLPRITTAAQIPAKLRARLAGLSQTAA